MSKNLIVLAGGKGSRFKEVDESIQKIIFPVANKPFIEYLKSQYSLFDRVIYALGDRAETIIPFCDEYVVEDKELGTGGASLFTFQERNLNSSFVTNGDTFYDFKEEFVFENHTFSTIYLVRKEDVDKDKGGVTIEGDLVSSFIEKEGQGDYLSIGLYYIKKSDLELFSGKFSLEYDLFPELVKKKKLKFKVIDVDVYDVGTKKGLENFKTSYVL